MEDAFLKDIAAHPDDVAPRLIYADWLSEQIDVALIERGEFIRLQHALASGTVAPGERAQLLARQADLLACHRQQWEEPLHGLVRSHEYHLGFPDRVTLDVEHLFTGFEELIARSPVVRVRLHGLTPATVADIASVRSLSHLRELDLQCERVQPGALEALLASPHLTRLRYLNLARNALGDEGVRVLIRSDVLARLHHLNLAATGLSVVGLRELLQAVAYHHAIPLQCLVLRGAPRLAGRELPPLPPSLPFRLRQSIIDQVARDRPPRTPLLESLHRGRTTLAEDLRRWVDWLAGHEPPQLVRALTVLPLPAAVHRAFAAVCQRRMLWRAERSRSVPHAIPAAAASDGDALAQLVGLLLQMAAAAHEEAIALRECLLDLYQRHQRDDLPADGRTR